MTTVERPEHSCRPPDCPGIHMHPDIAEQIHRKWPKPCALKPFTCKCGRKWKVYKGGWIPDE